MKTISSLRPSLMQSQLLLKTAPFEPLWLGSCRIQLSRWGPLYAKLEAIATRVSVLESLLESENLPSEAKLYPSVTWCGAVRGCAATGSTARLCGLSWCGRRGLCTTDAGMSILLPSVQHLLSTWEWPWHGPTSACQHWLHRMQRTEAVQPGSHPSWCHVTAGLKAAGH